MANGEEIPLSPFQSLLLGLVYGHGIRGISHALAAHFLWDQPDGKVQRHRLSQLRHQIKHRGGIDVICRSNDILVPNLRSVGSDYPATILTGKDAPHRDLSSSFLSKIARPPTSAYSAWMDGQRASLRVALGKAWASSLREAKQTNDWVAAVHLAEHLLGLEISNQSALYTLVYALAISVGPEAAIDRYRAHIRVFESTWGTWAPEGNLVDLIDVLPQHPIAESRRPSSPHGTPLFGRVEELAMVRSFLAQPRNGPSTTLITGEAGIGKSRLIAEAMKHAMLAGQKIVYAQSREFEGRIPLNPWIDVLSLPEVMDSAKALGAPWKSVLASLTTEWDGAGVEDLPPDVPPPSLQRRSFEAILRVLETFAGDTPICIVLDDFHWCDETSLTATEFLRRRWKGPSLNLILACRNEDIPFTPYLRNYLKKIPSFHDGLSVQLGPLSDEACTALVEDASCGRATKEEAAHLALVAGKNPFLAIELGRDFSRPTDQSNDQVTPQLSPSIRQLIEGRLARLPRELANFMGLFATIQGLLSIGDLQALTEEPESKLLSMLEKGREAGLLTHDGTHSNFRHDLIRQGIYNQLSPERRQAYHLRIARFLEKSTSARAPSQLALHYHRANKGPAALKWALRAARVAEDSGAATEAIQLLEIARIHSLREEDNLHIVWRLGELHLQQRNLLRAAPLLEISAHRLRSLGSHEEAARLMVKRISILGQDGAIPVQDALQELSRIRHQAVGRNEWEVVAEACESEMRLHTRSDNYEDARACLAIAEQFQERGSTRARCLLKLVLYYHQLFGDPETAFRGVTDSLKLARTEDKLTDQYVRSLARLTALHAERGTLYCPEAADLPDLLRNRAHSSGDLHLEFITHANLGAWHIDVGEIASGAHQLDLAEAIIRGTHDDGAHLILAVNRGELALLRRDYADAIQAFEEALRLLSEHGHHRARAMVLPGLGLSHLRFGNLSKAQEFADRTQELGEVSSADPTLQTLFTVGMFERRHEWENALSILREARRRTEGRRMAIWLKLCAVEIRLLKRKELGEWKNLRDEALAHSVRLRLKNRESEFRHMT